jgi:hypothetical protein
MKHLSTLCLFFLLIACGQKSVPEANSKDSVTSEAVTPSVTAPKDSVVAEPTATQTTTQTETPKEEKKETGPKPLLCKFQKLEPGECLTYVFDCATFGLEAVSPSLPKDQADIWNNLMAFSEDHGDAPIANAQYVGKTFAILQAVVERDVCQGGNMVKQKATTVTSFKLAK